MSGKKQLRAIFGLASGPITGTAVYKKDMEFDHPNIQTNSWIVINDQNKTLVHANTYDGRLGRNYDPTVFTHAIPTDAKDLRKKLKGYTQVTTDLPEVFRLIGGEELTPLAEVAQVEALTPETEETEEEDADDDEDGEEAE